MKGLPLWLVFFGGQTHQAAGAIEPRCVTWSKVSLAEICGKNEADNAGEGGGEGEGEGEGECMMLVRDVFVPNGSKKLKSRSRFEVTFDWRRDENLTEFRAGELAFLYSDPPLHAQSGGR